MTATADRTTEAAVEAAPAIQAAADRTGADRTGADEPGSARPFAIPATMRAIVQDAYGSADRLAVEEIPVPAPGPGQVLLRVGAASVNRGTWHLMTGRPWIARLGLGLRRPKQRVAGQDVAGTVIATGPDVTTFAPGDEVFGVAEGSLAQYAVAPVTKLARRPAGVTPEAAAATAISGLTALQALRDAGRVTAGQHVLVAGASGGVGSFAVQLAVAMGAQVTAVASGAKAAFVRGLGATRVLDYAREDAFDGSVRYDLILDIGGNRSLRKLRRGLTPKGTLVIIGGEGGDRLTGGIGRMLRAMLLNPFVSHRLTMLYSAERGADVEVLADYLASGAVRPAIDSVRPLAATADALRDLEAGRIRGKAVIGVAG